VCDVHAQGLIHRARGVALSRARAAASRAIADAACTTPCFEDREELDGVLGVRDGAGGCGHCHGEGRVAHGVDRAQT
jgi:hypothetical protein